jgi:hypothetical protein
LFFYLKLKKNTYNNYNTVIYSIIMKFKITYIDNNTKNERNIMNNNNDFQEELSQIDTLVIEYIESLNDNEKKTLTIAKQHLETSFCIEKSNGFINWIKNRK